MDACYEWLKGLLREAVSSAGSNGWIASKRAHKLAQSAYWPALSGEAVQTMHWIQSLRISIICTATLASTASAPSVSRIVDHTISLLPCSLSSLPD
ncbi:protein of unknown function [Paraburkholderia dioscoreae]|uniref:Uncharacterized protein n=1 Tax=Paraburkholderia dioscoreae TaxID=2604047 RepID=A0A5Q4Z6Q7_9BURK|nr:protein of unknown function [Paraburkholderia dioscoreae]